MISWEAGEIGRQGYLDNRFGLWYKDLKVRLVFLK